MRILVTGGCGFIGANFLLHSVRRYPQHTFLNADALTYAANPLSVQPLETASNYRFAHCDVADPDAIGELFADYRPELVVHLAAESHVDRSILGPLEFIRTNIEGTFVLLEACRASWRNGPGLFHHVSTDEVYGSLGPEGRFTEESRYDPSSPYSASKAASDHLVRAFARTYGLQVTITHSSNNYGPYQFPEKLIPLMILNALERQPLPIYGTGRNVRDWLFVQDHCEALWLVIEHGKPGETYDIGGNNELENIQVVDMLCEILAEETHVDRDELLALKRLVPDRPGHDFRYAIDSSKIRDHCGWQPKETMESGLRKTVRWYLANQQWVESVRTGEYRRWLDRNYGERA